MKRENKNYNAVWDILGISASTLCAIHCLLLPLLIPVLAVFGLDLFHSHKFDVIVIFSAMTIAFYSLTHGYLKRHRKLYPFIFWGLSAAFFFNREIFGHEYEHLVAVGGSFFIVLTHFVNWRLCQSCPVCKH